jgi:ribosomal protein L37E
MSFYEEYDEDSNEEICRGCGDYYNKHAIRNGYCISCGNPDDFASNPYYYDPDNDY